MTEVRIFLSENNQATFTCPKCGNAKTKDVSEFKDIDKIVRLKCKCSCGHVYPTVLERRKFRRRKTNLPGIYIWGDIENRAKMTVKDLSCLGLRFERQGKTPLKIGDVLFVEFRLDDKAHTLIRKEVIVKNISENWVGAAFCSLDPEDFCIMSEYTDIS